MFHLSSDRLSIRELSLSDSAFMLSLLNSPSWIKYIGDRGVRTEIEATSYIRNGAMKSYADHGYGLWHVSLHSGEPIGICGLAKRDFLNDVDLGFGFLPKHQRKGFGHESSVAVLDYATSALQVQRVIAITTLDNQASISLLQKLDLKNLAWSNILIQLMNYYY